MGKEGGYDTSGQMWTWMAAIDTTDMTATLRRVVLLLRTHVKTIVLATATSADGLNVNLHLLVVILSLVEVQLRMLAAQTTTQPPTLPGNYD